MGTSSRCVGLPEGNHRQIWAEKMPSANRQTGKYFAPRHKESVTVANVGTSLFLGLSHKSYLTSSHSRFTHSFSGVSHDHQGYSPLISWDSIAAGCNQMQPRDQTWHSANLPMSDLCTSWQDGSPSTVPFPSLRCNHSQRSDRQR